MKLTQAQLKGRLKSLAQKNHADARIRLFFVIASFNSATIHMCMGSCAPVYAVFPLLKERKEDEARFATLLK